MSKVFNFSAGPSALPPPVMERAREEFRDYQGLGVSVMEISHRSREFIEIAEQAEADLRELLNLNDDYHVLFLHGGGSMQFAMVPLNLANILDTVDYVETGSWSTKAITEAKRLTRVNIAATSRDHDYDRVPGFHDWRLSQSARYVHVTSNETIGGVQFHEFPDTGDTPLVADMSSDFLSRPIEVRQFGLIYAGAQKNVGPAGLCIVIVRKDLCGKEREHTPSLLSYRVHAQHQSMFNTPPTYNWYLAGLVLGWLKHEGGLKTMDVRNRRKADKLYAAIDRSDLYQSPVQPADRSIMNVPFTLMEPELEDRFIETARMRGLLNLKGHRSVGGIRASLYNAIDEEAVDALIEHMESFEKAER